MSGGTTGMDIRLPIGLMFTIVGGILVVFGALTNDQTTKGIYADHSLGINVNLWWGLVLALFGIIMLALCWGAAQKEKK
jgi:ABC-type Fe3+-siderophore transport system permease subunit